MPQIWCQTSAYVSDILLILHLQGPKTPEMKNKNKVFLGGLPANVTETIIRESFEPFGVVGIRYSPLTERTFQLFVRTDIMPVK